MHFIRFGEQSLASYDGHLEGLPATSPRVTGRPIDVNSRAATDYVNFLRNRHQDYLSDISRHLSRRAEPSFQYLNVLNAVAMPLTPQEANLIRGLPFVVDVAVERIETLDTDAGPQLIGAPEFWDGVTSTGLGNKGEGVIIGIIDSGFNHSHPSFAEVASDGHVHTNPLGDGVFLGVCAGADGVEICNNKLIGSYNFHPDTSAGSEDTDSHGTHVASTAGGNPVEASFQGLTVPISGVAPRANLVNYKVCEPTCPQTSSVAAVNQAIIDRVDVLNYSISGSDNPWNNIVDLAFLDANAAGIFVAASAGNDGPGASTVAKTGPWNSAVGNSTHGRIFAQTVSLAGLADVAGVPGTGPELQNVFSGQLRYAGDVEATNFEGCNAFPPNAFDGEAALISRGNCTFATKVDNAVAAGAEFVVVFNSQGGPPTSMGGLESTAVPSLMITDSDGAVFIAQLASGTALLTVSPEVSRFEDATQFADIMATGSSRGPSQFNLLAPTVTAPGTSILAAATDDRGQFIAIGGTSMASPHMAGSAALLIGQDQGLTPTEVRSALTLSANPNHRKEDGVTPADPFDMGSGRLDVAAAANIGFVMDETFANFVAANPAEGGDPSTLNLSSIKSLRCAGTCSYQRTVRSVLDVSARYVVTYGGTLGSDISVTPGTFILPAGESLTLDIDIDVADAPRDVWLFGEINILPADDDPISPARLPVAVTADDEIAVVSVSPTSLSSTQETDDTTTASVEIASSGELPLEWSLVELGPRDIVEEFVGPGVLWNNPQAGASGRINNYANAVETGIYQTDFFQLLTRSRIETISSAGFTLGNPGVTELVWMVFANDEGVPAGHPETDPDSAIWSFTASPNDSGVSFANADMFLDLEAAGAPELVLEPGFYWLVAYPKVQTYSLGPNNLYAWFHGASGAGRQIGPGGLSGFPDAWGPVPEGRAFNLTGSVQCAAENIEWLTASPTSGTVAPGESQTVTVTFESAGLAEDTYLGSLCVTSNARDGAFSLLPVALTVENLPDGSIDTALFGSSLVFGDSDQETVALTNQGKGELTFNVVGASESLGVSGNRASELLYDQTASQTTFGANATYDLDGPATFAVQAADDFTVPPGEVWSVDRVVANGFYLTFSTFNPADSVRIFLYEDDAGEPGIELASFFSLTPSADIEGQLTLNLPSAVSLSAGTYWLSVQPEMDFFDDGLWFWLINEDQTGSRFHWRNPGGFYADGACTDWRPSDECGFDNPDLSFQIFGSSSTCDLVDEVPWLSVSP
ncbi:MAG: hypothetical protein EA370_15580, partial [Wenzhouxiangella sp.]